MRGGGGCWSAAVSQLRSLQKKEHLATVGNLPRPFYLNEPQLGPQMRNVLANVKTKKDFLSPFMIRQRPNVKKKKGDIMLQGDISPVADGG